MKIEPVRLEGRHIVLEPLELAHTPALAKASAGADTELYRWSPVPQSETEARRYIETALAWRDAGTGLAFATVRKSDGVVIGSTRFFDIERWAWPAGHPEYGRSGPDACEIGYTWLTPTAIRTPANTEAKLWMLTHAFESWKVHRVCFHTDVRNERSRMALARIGGKFEGILRAHRMAADFIARDSARFSIIAAEWPEAKRRLETMLQQ
ncbi:MAG TPA: GNAT family protein [Candidatus Limnocylindrales bacterium]|jgi:RimJ/RimL family protein N-acetyltransferase|nr:GNAT family protein [Candidatus Limnocylindrales bacterium]